jgi:hypothetical protein
MRMGMKLFREVKKKGAVREKEEGNVFIFK